MTQPDGSIKPWQRLLLQVLNRRKNAGERLAPVVHHSWSSRDIAADGVVHMRPGDVRPGQPAQIFVYEDKGLTGAGVSRIEVSDLRSVTNFQTVTTFRATSSVLGFKGGGTFAFTSDCGGSVTESITRKLSGCYRADGSIRILGPARESVVAPRAGLSATSKNTGQGQKRVELYDLKTVILYQVLHMAEAVSHALAFKDGGTFVFVMDQKGNVIESHASSGVFTTKCDDGVIRVFGTRRPEIEAWKRIAEG